MESGEFILIDYVARVKGSGEIFDLTKEDVARKEGLYREGFKYGPVPVIIDGNFVLPGLNDTLKEMKVGEKKTVSILPEKAFGERSGELIKLIPESKFKEQNIDTGLGSVITINRLRGRIVSVDGGRVKVDFNHPLAGKELEYQVEIVGMITDLEEKIKAIVYYFTGFGKDETKVLVNQKEVEVILNKKADLNNETKEIIAKNIMKWVVEMEKVRFVDVFEKGG